MHIGFKVAAGAAAGIAAGAAVSIMHVPDKVDMADDGFTRADVRRTIGGTVLGAAIPALAGGIAMGGMMLLGRGNHPDFESMATGLTAAMAAAGLVGGVTHGVMTGVMN